VTDLSWIGFWLLVVGVVAILLEGILALVWSLRMARRSREINERLTSEQARLQADFERLRNAVAETQALWQPYRRLLRWLRHPLAIAVMQSFARRRAAAR
jgi:ABC-type bacteriocin/lantibiotic exporter with double-glycine peptidase domain